MSVTIAELGIEDAALVLEWVGRLLMELGEEGEERETLSSQKVLDAWRDSGDRFQVLVARDEGGAPVGLLTLVETFAIYADGPYGIINEMLVAPAHRSSGVGRMLLDAAKAHGRKRGWARLDVTAPESARWGRTRLFYEREGFVFTGPKLKFRLV